MYSVEPGGAPLLPLFQAINETLQARMLRKESWIWVRGGGEPRRRLWCWQCLEGAVGGGHELPTVTVVVRVWSVQAG
jgi:hypothetical protein